MGTPDLAVACPLTSQPRPRPRAEPAGPVGRESRACQLGDSRHTASCCAARAGSQPQRGQGGVQRPHTGGQLMAASAGAGRGQPQQAQRHSGNQRPGHCPEAAGLGSWCPAGMPGGEGTPSLGPICTGSAGTRRNPSWPMHWVSPSPAASPAKANREMLPTGGPGDKGAASALGPAALRPIQEDLKPEQD